MNIATSIRVLNRAIGVTRHISSTSAMYRSSLNHGLTRDVIGTRIQYRLYTTNKTAGNDTANANKDKKPEGTPEPKEAKSEQPEQTADQKMIAKLQEELEEAKKEMYIALADRQTSQRIAKEDVRKAKEYGIQKFAATLFDVNDILERAIEAVKPETLATNPDLKNFYEGVQMTEKLLLKAYEQNDIKRFYPLGQKFDPNLHQALQEVPDPSKENGTVCYVMKAGYQLKDRLLRAASVAVVKTPKQEEPAASP